MIVFAQASRYIPPMDTHQIIFTLIMIVAVVLFITDVLRVDIVAVLIILALSIFGLIDSNEAFSGFSSEPAIIVAAVFILSAGLRLTGVTDIIGEWVGRLAGKSETRANLVIMTAVAAMSAFTHHLMVTAMMLPIVMKICKEKGLHASRLLIPMATAASLGTTLTLIGAPAFLLANNILKRSGEPALGIFSVAKVGIPLTLASFVFILLMKWMLPKKAGAENLDERFKLTEISTEILVPEGSKWIGVSLKELLTATEKRFTVLSWLRNRHALDLHGDALIASGDIFLVKTDSDELISFEEKLGLTLHAVKKFGDDIKENTANLAGEENRIFKALIAPHSEFIGKALKDIHFYHRFGVVAVGLWRKLGWLSEGIADVPLQQGDLVVLWGPEQKLESLTQHRGFLMFLPFTGQPKKRAKMNVATAIMTASIVMAAMGWLPAYVSFVTGALCMVLSGCVSISEAYDSIETKIFVMIAGVIPLGIAMEKTGVDKLIAHQLQSLTHGWQPFAMLMVFYWISALLTQIMSDAATTVLLAPIALAFAKVAGISPTGAVITVTVAAVASFLTPIGHHGNLLILTPGGYRFADFLKIGLPLTILLSIITCYASMTSW
jgi:di/tricarboxylate transporter